MHYSGEKIQGTFKTVLAYFYNAVSHARCCERREPELNGQRCHLAHVYIEKYWGKNIFV